MKLHFCRSGGPAAWFIRFMTMSQWNHVAIEVYGVVYDATGLNGVRSWSLDVFDGKYQNREVIEVDCDDDVARKFLEGQLGKKYDFGALFAMPSMRDWQDPDKWFCSELASAALIAGGVQQLRVPPGRVTPRDLWVSIY